MDLQKAPPSEDERRLKAHGSSAVAKRLWHIVRAVYYMLRKELSKGKLMMELHLLLKRGKIAGKAIGNLMFHHNQHQQDRKRPDHIYSSTTATGGGGYYAAFTCRSMDPDLSYYNPHEVEFSCSNTPSYPFHLNKRRKRNYLRHNNYGYDDDVATVRKAIEIINSQLQASESPDVMASPSPAPFWGLPTAPVKQLRITDSPFLAVEDSEVDGQVDSKAEEFIKHFYEQLRTQRTPSIEPGRYRRQAVYA